jgi:adenylate kinase
MVDYAIFGPPGAGKGTQATALCNALGVEHFSTGDAFRSSIKRGTALGAVVRGYMERGELVSDELVLSVVADELDQRAGGVLFDGFPRTVVQARGLLELLGQSDRVLGGVVNLVVEVETVVGRIALRRSCPSCNAVYHLKTSPSKADGVCDRCSATLIHRADDRPDVVAHRLAVYFEQTAPVLDYFRDRVPVIDIDGERAVDVVAASILAGLQSH